MFILNGLFAINTHKKIRLLQKLVLYLLVSFSLNYFLNCFGLYMASLTEQFNR